MDSGLPAQTLAEFLAAPRLSRGGVVILDEAAQVGVKKLARLVRHVRTSERRLILSGDTRHHGAVAASDALRAIEKYARPHPAEIRTIRRQDPAKAATRGERAFIRQYRSAVKAAADGNVAASFGALDRLGCIREVGENQRRAAVAVEYLVALERQERTLVVAQTRKEARQVNEAIRERLREAGKLGAGVVLRTCRLVNLDDTQKRDARFIRPYSMRASFVDTGALPRATFAPSSRRRSPAS